MPRTISSDDTFGSTFILSSIIFGRIGYVLWWFLLWPLRIRQLHPLPGSALVVPRAAIARVGTTEGMRRRRIDVRLTAEMTHPTARPPAPRHLIGA